MKTEVTKALSAEELMDVNGGCIDPDSYPKSPWEPEGPKKPWWETIFGPDPIVIHQLSALLKADFTTNYFPTDTLAVN